MIKLASAASCSGSSSGRKKSRGSKSIQSAAVPILSASNEFGDIKTFLELIKSQKDSNELYRAETKGKAVDQSHMGKTGEVIGERDDSGNLIEKSHVVEIPMSILARIVDKFMGALLGAASETNATYDAFKIGFNHWLKFMEKRIAGTYGDSWENLTTGFVKSGVKRAVAYEMDPKRGKKSIEQHGTKFGNTIRIDDVEEGQPVREIGVEDKTSVSSLIDYIRHRLGDEFAEYAIAKFEVDDGDKELKAKAKARAKEIEKRLGKKRLNNEFLPKLYEVIKGDALDYDGYVD
jgi:hypothetical protein